MLDHLPAAFKWSRREAAAFAAAPGDSPLPDVAVQLCYMHAYAALAFAEGFKYEMMSARHLGASKALVLDVLNYAYLSAGPRGMNAVAQLSSQYLRDRQDDPAADPVGWPPGWGPDPSAFRAGIDYTTSELSEIRRSERSPPGTNGCTA